MISFRISLINLLRLYLIFCDNHSGFCLDTVWKLPKPSISDLQANNDTQTLLVSWLVNHSGLAGDIYELQIGRTENRTIIYSRNMSLFPVESNKYTWTWISDLPLECVDHFVRIRYFFNQSVPSPWSNWKPNNGVREEGKTRIFPHYRVLREGTSAMFCCVAPRGVNITNITFNKIKYPLISIGATVKAITVDNLTIPNRLIKFLTLRCEDATGKMGMTVLNYISFPPQKLGNLSCTTSDMTTVTCTWDSGRKRYPHDRNNQTQTLQIENSDQAPISCEESSCTFPAVPQLEEYNIRVVVRNQLGEETASYSFNISDRVFPVVEWYTVSPEVTDTTVSWIVHGNLTQLNLFCQVTTDPGSTNELSCNSVSGICIVKLENLLPNTCYSTKVRCSVNGRLWGGWTQPTSFITYPLVTLDVWRRITLSDPNSRQVTLLWTPHAPGSAATVKIQGYIIQWSQEGQNETKWKNSSQTLAHVSINLGQCNFTVQAVLHSGSTIPAHITIPPRDHGENLPAEKRLSSTATADFNLSWEEQDTATCGYTVEWCILGNTANCTLRWMKVPEGNNALFLPARNFEAGCRYTFNIYGCTENGHRLLERQTGYSQELKSVLPPSLVEPVQSTSSSVTLEWSYNEDDPAHSAFIIGYLVTVQKEGSNMLPDHAANLFNVPVADPRRKSVTLEGLQQNQEYVFSVSAVTKEGPGQSNSIIIRTRTSYSAHLVKILTPILLLLCCTILLLHQRKTLRTGLKGIFFYPAGMNIKTPELDSFLNEISERLQSQKVEECSSCDIEILRTRPPLNETTALCDPEPMNTLSSPGSQTVPSALSLSHLLLQVDSSPESVTVLWDRPTQQMACLTNKTYFHTMEERLRSVLTLQSPRSTN